LVDKVVGRCYLVIVSDNFKEAMKASDVRAGTEYTATRGLVLVTVHNPLHAHNYTLNGWYMVCMGYLQPICGDGSI
jgi:hypothetical protein